MSTEGRTQFTLMIRTDPIYNSEGAGVYDAILHDFGDVFYPETYLQTGGAGGVIMVQFTVGLADVDRVTAVLRHWSDTTFEAHAA